MNTYISIIYLSLIHKKYRYKIYDLNVDYMLIFCMYWISFPQLLYVPMLWTLVIAKNLFILLICIWYFYCLFIVVVVFTCNWNTFFAKFLISYNNISCQRKFCCFIRNREFCKQNVFKGNCLMFSLSWNHIN